MVGAWWEYGSTPGTGAIAGYVLRCREQESLGLAKAYQGHTHSNKVASVEPSRAILNQTTTHTNLAPKCRLLWSVPVTVESATNVGILALVAYVLDT